MNTRLERLKTKGVKITVYTEEKTLLTVLKIIQVDISSKKYK